MNLTAFFSAGVVFAYAVLLLLFTHPSAHAQYRLEIKPHPAAEEAQVIQALDKIAYRNAFPSASDARKELQKVWLLLQEKGYLAASFDSLATDSTGMQAFLVPGGLYHWIQLGKGNIDEGLLNETGFREKLWRHKPVSNKELHTLEEKILTYCENNGYPFASIRLDSIHLSDTEISASLALEKNTVVHIDSIRIRGNAKIAPAYLYNYLGIKPGMLYNEAVVKKTGTRLKELVFVRETQPFSVVFIEKKAIITLFLENKKPSRFDGIIGVLPNEKQPGKVTVTGEVRLALQNAFGRGEGIDLQWKTVQKNTQDLRVRAVYPFAFSTPFGADLFFLLYKKDTSYIDLVRDLGVQYLLSGGNYLKLFIHNKQSSLLSSTGFEYATTLPPHAGVNVTLYGAGIKHEKLDYRYNPRKGYALELTAGAGNRVVEINPKLNPVLYDSISLRSTEYNIGYVTDVYIPWRNRSVLRTGMRGEHKTGASFFQNELYRFGGLKTLRGFDEESLLATSYHILTLEYRYLLEQNSYLCVFWNGSWYETKGKNTTVHDTPYGFGAGITFDTKLGIFSINYALGKQFGNPVYFRSGKVHFGMINYF